MKKQTRAYKQDARAQQTEANAQEIVQATVERIRAVRRVSEITLDEVAAKSGMTVRTILRRFGSRDGLLEAAFQALHTEVEGFRPPTPPGDVDAALRVMLTQYEHMGDMNIRALEEEDQIPLLHELLNMGRKSHREWIATAFGPQLAGLSGPDKERTITSLYAATDVYLWKLMRRDLGLGKRETADTFRRLVSGVLGGE